MIRPMIGVLALVAFASPALAQNEELLERLGDVENRLDEVEKKTVLDRIALDGDYRTIINSFIYKSELNDVPDATNEEAWSHRLRIRFRAEPTDNIRVTARMVMYKNFFDGDSPITLTDSGSTRRPRDNGFRLDQAWIDWFPFEWLGISAGRIAYTDGPPADLIENSPVRMGTWGLQVVDAEYDTFNVTVNFSKWLPNTYARLFYASFWFDNDDVTNRFPFLTDGRENLRSVGGNLETSFSALGNNFFQIGYFIIPRFTPVQQGIDDPGFNPQFSFTNAPGEGLLYPSKYPDTLGTYQTAHALVQLRDIGGSGLDVFVSGSIAFLDSSNKGVEYNLPDPTNPAARRSTPLLFLTGTGEDGRSAFFYAGMRYQLPIEAMNNPKFGLEFNYGSKFLTSLAQPTDRLISKLATRGKAVEAYFTIPFGEHLWARLGYLHINRDFTGDFLGPSPVLVPWGSTSQPSDEIIHDFSLTLAARL